jgi:hypothetical protein
MTSDNDATESVDEATEAGADARSISRRVALKKAATAASVAGVAWAAPSVKGLSIIPDYSAAALSSIHGYTVTVKFGDTNGSTYPGANNYFAYKASPNTSPSSPGPNQNSALKITASLGIAGSAVMTVAQGVLADGNPFGGSIAFNVGPNNQCRITGITSHPGPGPGNNFSTVPLPNSPTFTQNFNVGDHPGPTSRVDDVTITITCS